MPLSPVYDAKQYEAKIYADWQFKGLGSPEKQSEIQDLNDEKSTYTILMPPPNLTGNLHAGHAYEHFVMDTMTRIARQQGKKSLWYPGVDHAGIQMEGVVSKLLQAEGKDPNVMKKENKQEFLDFAWEKAREWRGNQQAQSSILGDTPDYSRQLFTLDDRATRMVNYAFEQYWRDGLIYKNSYLINWSVGLQTALSDVQQDVEWVEQKDPFVTFSYTPKRWEIKNPEQIHNLDSTIEFVKNYLKSASTWPQLHLSTVRIETKFTDLAVAMHPAKFKAYFNLDLFDTHKAGFNEKTALKILEHFYNQNISVFYHLPELDSGELKLVLDSQFVDAEFGTGIVKVTPAHDLNDYNMYKEFVRRGLLETSAIQSCIGRDGKMKENCGEFAGQTVLQTRIGVIKKLIDNENIPVKEEFAAQEKQIKTAAKLALESEAFDPTEFSYIEGLKRLRTILGEYANQLQINWDYSHNVLYCERSKTQVEPLISEEFFLSYANEIERDGQQTSLQQIGLQGIEEMEFYPAEKKEQALNFIENIHDWCISRDLVWGHKIPIWYNLDVNPGKKFYSSEELSKFTDSNAVPFKISLEKPTEYGNWVQEEKILDTWFSSCLWPLSTLDFYDFKHGKAGSDFETYYPTQMLTSATDIFYAWIVRMVILNKYFTGKVPFEKYFCHATILDEQGRKMSKSLKNGLDPVEQIEKFSSDSLRLAILGGTIPGRNMRLGGQLADKICEKYRNFGNKLWNVARFLESKKISGD